MKFYLAPLEGLTTYVYRNVYHHFFHPMDKYFTPFIVPHPNRGFKPKELKEILPQHNQGLCVVPQILTNNAEDFIRTAQEFREYGYEEINLNLGCPSGTVTAKKKGSGFLGYPDELERFLYEIFERTESKISIKTRIGVEHPEEFERLLNIYNKFEMEELIIHPRVRADFYKNKPNMEVFGQAVKESKNRLCYNGDLFIKSHFEAFEKEYPQVERVMLGRGVMVNPGLINLWRKSFVAPQLFTVCIAVWVQDMKLSILISVQHNKVSGSSKISGTHTTDNRVPRSELVCHNRFI